jgi:hypothetical protein
MYIYIRMYMSRTRISINVKVADPQLNNQPVHTQIIDSYIQLYNTYNHMYVKMYIITQTYICLQIHRDNINIS